jgi:hypothetical protein
MAWQLYSIGTDLQSDPADYFRPGGDSKLRYAIFSFLNAVSVYPTRLQTQQITQPLGTAVCRAAQHAANKLTSIMAKHSSPRTTKLYDRREEEISLEEVERIAI